MIVLDIQALQCRRGHDRGIPRYVDRLSAELLKIPRLVHSLCLNPTRPFPKNLSLDLLYSGRVAWGGAGALRKAFQQGAKAYWILSPFEPEAKYDTLLPRAATGSVPIVVTLQDLIPLIFPDTFLASPGARARYRNSIEIVKMADLVLCMSESTREDAIQHLGLPRGRLHVTGSGVDQFFNPEDGRSLDAAILRERLPQLDGPYIFTLPSNAARKNLDGLLKAFSRLRLGCALVIGGTYDNDSIAKALSSLEEPLAKKILFPGPIDDACLRALYRSCELFVFPSKYEGFGLPLAEALACGAPAIASRASSICELADDEIALFDPQASAAMAEAMERGLTDAAMRERLRAMAHRNRDAHRWSKVAERSLEALRTLETRRAWSARAARPSIALAGPFPPQRSGVADYNFRIARELARIADLFLFHAGECDLARLRELGPAGCHPIADLGTRVSPQYLDAVIYAIGNSNHHGETLDKLLEYPGIVWLHDIHVLDLYDSHYQRQELEEIAQRMYGERQPPPTSEPSHPNSWRDWGLHFTSEIVKASRALIVGSEHAREMLALDQGPLSRPPPICVFPLAAPAGERETIVFPPRHAPVISTFGFLDPIKAPDLLIDAVSLLPAELNVQLNLAGFAYPSYEKDLLDRARLRGLGGSVRITGFLDQEEWFGHIARSTCAVQLRRQSNGESSGAVADCLALGLPVITNAAACRDMPKTP